MNNSKNNNKTENINSNDMTKKSSLPLIVGTSAILFAGVISCDINSTVQLNNALNSTIAVSPQNVTAQLKADNSTTDDNKKKSSSKCKSYFTNTNGEIFYNSDAEDDEFYYRNCDNDTLDTDDVFLIW